MTDYEKAKAECLKELCGCFQNGNNCIRRSDGESGTNP